MKKYNYIILTILLILFICFVYLKMEFDGIVVDPMSDGQAGIGKAVTGLLILGIGLISFVISTITGIILIFKKSSRNKLSLVTLFFSLVLSILILLIF
jgi:hypothetical protein